MRPEEAISLNEGWNISLFEYGAGLVICLNLIGCDNAVNIFWVFNNTQ